MRSSAPRPPENSARKHAAGTYAGKEHSSGTSPMHAARLKSLYSFMLRMRMVDNLLRTILPQRDSIQPREAVLAGAAIHLQQGDLVAPSGDVAHDLMQAKPLAAVLEDLKPAGGNLRRAKAGSSEVSPSAAATFNMAVGMALAHQLQQKPGITLCLTHERNRALDFWSEAVSFASARQLGIVFVVSHPAEAREEASLRAEAQALLPAITVDGSDVVAVYRVAEETTRRARQGLGPSLIECQVDARRDPLRFMEEYLLQRNLWSDAWKRGLIEQFTREIDAAVKKIRGRSATRPNTAASA